MSETPEQKLRAYLEKATSALKQTKQRLQELGVQLESEGEVNAAFTRFKELADRKSEIFDEDILALVSDESVSHVKEQYAFVSLSQRSETGERPQARNHTDE